MAARTLVQALEGVSFPCDRGRLIEYARNNNVSARALAALEDIPQRQYRDLGEVFTALPGRPEVEEIANLEQAQELWWEQGWRQGMAPLEVMVHCLRVSADTWPQWVRLGQRLMFPWMK